MHSSNERVNKANVNPDLASEREKCDFDQEEITNLIDGGKDKTELRRKVENFFLERMGVSDKDFDRESLSSLERYNEELAANAQFIRIAMEAQKTDDIGQEAMVRMNGASNIASTLLPDGAPMAMHYAMFLPALLGQASTDQQAEWLGPAWNLNLIGTYAQTELGHGTFIRGLETTATYDPHSEQFVLNSPTLTSYKWWPGSLGNTANHALVMAQLETQGQKLGPHAFLVQLRDLETHAPMPGVDVGEIGMKMGMNGNDNGFLGFKNYRIPRKNMLMKSAQVLPDGTYVKPEQAKHSYSTMVFVRCRIVMDVTSLLIRAVTIAVRYSAVRRQSELRPNEPEPKIMEYQTQQYKLFPHLAMCFAFSLAGHKLWSLFENFQGEQDEGDFSAMPELHSLTCGMKALITHESAMAIDVLRRACGGHGFMASSSMPRIFGLATAACTYEGENTVLELQVARFLVKSYRLALSDPTKSLPDSVAYLQTPLKATPPSAKGLTSARNLTNLFQYVAKGQLQEAVKSLDASLNNKMHPADAWNQSSQELVLVSAAHERNVVIQEFARVLYEKEMSKPVKNIQFMLFEVLASFWILRHSGDFIKFANVTPLQMLYLRQKTNLNMSQLRSQAVNLVDAFDVPDISLRSTLGSYDGQVYERMFKAARNSERNKTDVPEAFEKHIKPLLKSSL